MKDFLCTDVQIKNNDKLLEQYLDTTLKEIPFTSKVSYTENNSLIYSNVLLPLLSEDLTNPEYLKSRQLILNQIVKISDSETQEKYIYSIFNIFKENILKISFHIITLISSNNMNIFYTDGSFKKATSEASYACCQLLNEGSGVDSMEDAFSDDKKEYLTYSGKIENGTNNIGELTGIKFAIEHFGEKFYQLIISDSEYSIKSFREWIYNWKKNGFKTYSKKPILNQDLIKEISNKIDNSEKIIFYKWTKGHANDLFNEKCDELAKKALGI